MEKKEGIQIRYFSIAENFVINESYEISNKYYQIFLFESDLGTIKINGTTYPIRNSLYFYNSKDYSTVCPEKPITIYSIIVPKQIFNNQYFDDLFSIFHTDIEHRLLNIDDTQKLFITKFFNKMHKFQLDNKNFSNEKILCELIKFLIYFNSNNLSTTIKTIEKKKNNITNSAIEYIHTNIENNFTLEDIAKNTFVSKYHLSHVFKKDTGMAIGEYVIREKMKYAQHLLQTGIPAQTASERVGYNYYYAFFRSYKRIMGKSPQEDYHPK